MRVSSLPLELRSRAALVDQRAGNGDGDLSVAELDGFERATASRSDFRRDYGDQQLSRDEILSPLRARLGASSGRVITGNVRVRSAADLDRLRGVEEITGSLTIERTDLVDLAPLASLKKVGKLWLHRNDQLRSLQHLSGLREIGALDLSGNPALTSLQGLEGVRKIPGYVHVRGTALTSLGGLAGLESVGGARYSDLEISGNDALRDLGGLEKLREVKGGLKVWANPLLRDLAPLGGLAEVGRSVSVRHNGALRSIDGLRGLASVGRLVSVHQNGLLDDLGAAFTGLRRSGSLVRVESFADPAAARALDARLAGALPSAKVVVSGGAAGKVARGRIVVRSAADLQALRGVETVLGSLIIEKADLTDRDLEALKDLRRVTHYLHVDACPRLTKLDGLRGLRQVDGNLFIANNPRLTSTAGLDGLKTAGHLAIKGNDALTALSGLDALEWAGGVDLGGNASLTRVDGLNGLELIGHRDSGETTIDGGLSLNFLPALESVDGLRALREVMGGVDVCYNPKLKHLDGLAALEHARTGLELRDNPLLARLHLPALTSVGMSSRVKKWGALVLDRCAALRDLRAPKLTSIRDLEHKGTPLAPAELAHLRALIRAQDPS